MTIFIILFLIILIVVLSKKKNPSKKVYFKNSNSLIQPSAVNSISAKSRSKAIEDMSSLLAESFIKGEWNKSSSKSYRLWHYPKYQSTVPIAANKILEEDGRYYKTGAGHGYK